MKELKKILFIVTLFILFISTGQASSVAKGSYIPNMYIKSNNTNNSRYLQSQFILNKTNNKVVYCLEPFVTFKENISYNELSSNQYKALNIDSSTFKKIETIAYFGYNYGNHTDSKWYSITQVLIWRTISPSSTINFTSTLNGNITDKYDKDLQELENLVNNYLSDPSFNNESINLNLGSSTTLDIGDYTIQEDDYISGTTGEITINGVSITDNKYELTKGYDDNTVYISDTYQNLLESSTPALKTANFNLKVTSSYLKISFINENDVHSNCTSDSKNTYGLYDKSRNLITTFEESIEAYISSELPLGTYYVKQLTATCDTKIMDNYNIVILNKNNQETEYNIYINKLSKKLNIKKTYGYLGNYLPEPNAKFVLKDNNKSIELETDKYGIATLNIGIGKYKLVQTSGLKNYNYIKDIDLEIKEDSDDEINLELINEIKKSNIIVNTIDQEHNNLSGIKVCLYDSNNNLKECLTSTNKPTIFSNYPVGEYEIKVEELDSYKIDNKKESIILDEKDQEATFIYTKVIKTEPPIEEPPRQEHLQEENNIIQNQANQTSNNKELTKESITIPNTFANDYLFIIAIIILIIIYEKH